MRERCQCPDCGSADTERVDLWWLEDGVEETRICNECPTQWRNCYHLFEQSVDEVPADD